MSPPPPPPLQQGLVESEFDTLKTGTTTKKQGVDPAIMSEDEVDDDDANVPPSSPPVSPQALTEEEIARKKAEQQYHIRFQATNQPWREDMSDEVKVLHDSCCSDFKNSGICIENFSGIADFKEIGAGAFACVYKATWEGNVVAVKKLATGVGQPMTLKTIRDFRTEAQLQRTLQHENIVRCERRKERSDDAPCEGERSETSSEYFTAIN